MAAAIRMAVKFVLVTVVVCGLFWLPIWVLTLLVWSTSEADPRAEVLPLWMRILLVGQKWFGTSWPFLVLVAAAFCALLLLARRFIDARRPRTPFCLTTAEVDGHTVTAWKTPVFCRQIVWLDGREVSRRRSFGFKSRHTFSVSRGSQEVVYEATLATFPCLALWVSRDGEVVAKARNAAGTAMAGLVGLPLLTLAGGLALALAIYMDKTGFGFPILMFPMLLGFFLVGRSMESMDRRRIDAHFEGRVGRWLPRWEWAALPIGVAVAASMWVLPTFSQYEKACEKDNGAACYFLGLMDPTRAAEQYQKACDLGYGHACNYLGIIYATGRGVEKDATKPVELYRRACDLGVAAGCSNLSLLFQNGNVVEEDLAKAAEL